ncbi:MAG: prenyltransferase/squalene oxidase repeat-containing protein [Gemmataceae bacterium]
MTKRIYLAVVLAAVVFALRVQLLGAADDIGAEPQQLKEVLEKAADYLKSRQGKNGSFSPKLAGPGVTAVVVAGLLRNGFRVDDPVVARGLGYLEKSVKADGGIYDRGLANYTTSVSIMALQEANKEGKYDAILKNATAYLKKLQSSLDKEDVKFGGVGYDNKSRPDLSNTQYFIDALIAAGVSKDDPAVKRALKFVSRCQNLPGETNDQPFAKKTSEDDKGGLVYVPFVADRDDKKHQTPEGGLRSLGAMTYGGLRSFLYAGVSKDDPRVKGAVRWIRRHYTLDENPGMGQAGLFYYYHTFGKAMTALGEDRFEDANGQKHDWRRELFEALKKRQQENGSFLNKGDKQFGEADPNLATGFALLALSYTKTTKK